MDLSLYARVIWRFRLLVAAGLIAAAALSFLSYARVSFAHGSVHIHYRQGETWEAQTRLLVAGPGFPQGALVPSATSATAAAVDSGRTTQLAAYYELLANSDTVQALVERDPTIHGTMQAQQMTSNGGRSSLPILAINGFAATGPAALHIAQRGAAIVRSYIERLQVDNNVPDANRVRLDVLNQAVTAQVLTGRKKTLPIVVFVTVLFAALGLAFILENLRPRIRAMPAQRAVSGDTAQRERLGA